MELGTILLEVNKDEGSPSTSPRGQEGGFPPREWYLEASCCPVSACSEGLCRRAACGLPSELSAAPPASPFCHGCTGRGRKRLVKSLVKCLTLFSVSLASHQDRQQNTKMGPEVENFRFWVNPLLATFICST